MATEPRGFFEENVVNEYLLEKGPLYTSSTVEYRLDPELLKKLHPRPLLMVPKDGNAGSASLGNHEVICMDVGAWIGNGPKNGKNHQRHREFGVVCGNVAVLCAFKGGKSLGYARPEDGVKPDLGSVGQGTYDNVVVPFLEYLASPLRPVTSSNASLPDLGNITVLGAMEARPRSLHPAARAQLTGDADTIHVFLGDLHLPIASDPRHPTLVGEEGSKAGPRAGRLDLLMGQRRRLVSAWAKSQAGGLGLLALRDPLATRASIALLGEASEEMWKVAQSQILERWEPERTDGLMKRSEAASWAEMYVGSDEKKGAEVFQDSGPELVAFLRRLRYWERRNGKRLHLVQTGDLFDFWIGLKRAFRPGKRDPDAINETPIEFPSQLDGFVQFWIDQTASNHRARGVVRELRKIIEGSGKDKERPRGARDLEITLLRGNHDNYMFRAHGGFSTLPQYRSRCGTIVAEHGHQSDSFNSDQDADKGWAMTQLAFIVPSIRELEDPAAMGATLFARNQGATDPGARLQRVARAAEECLTRNASIYVLGHTHQALLRKVLVRPDTEPARLRRRQLTCMASDARCIDEQQRRTQGLLDRMRSARDELVRDHREADANQRLLSVYIGLLEAQGQLRSLGRSLHGAGEAIQAAPGEAARGAAAAWDRTATAAGSARDVLADAWCARVAAAERAVQEAQRALDAAVQAGLENGRQNVEAAKGKLAEAHRELDEAVARGSAVTRAHAIEVKRRIEAAADALQRAEQESLRWAEQRVDGLFRQVHALMGATQREASELADDLRRRKTELERWAKDKASELQGASAKAQADLKSVIQRCRAALRGWKGGGGSFSGGGATGYW